MNWPNILLLVNCLLISSTIRASGDCTGLLARMQTALSHFTITRIQNRSILDDLVTKGVIVAGSIERSRDHFVFSSRSFAIQGEKLALITPTEGDRPTLIRLQGHVYSAELSEEANPFLRQSVNVNYRLGITRTAILNYERRSVSVEAFTKKVHLSAVRSTDVSPNHETIVTASEDRGVSVLSAFSGEELFRITRHTDRVYQACFSPDGHRIATASADHTVRLFNASDGGELFVYRGHRDEVMGLRFSPNGNRLLSYSIGDQTMRLINSNTVSDILSIEVNPIAYRSTRELSLYSSIPEFTPDGGRILYQERHNTIQVRSIDDGTVVFNLYGHMPFKKTGIFSADGSRAISVSQGNVSLINGITGEHIHRYENLPHIEKGFLSPSGRQIVLLAEDRRLIFLNSDNFRVSMEERLNEGLFDIRFSKNGDKVYILIEKEVNGSFGYWLKTYNLADGELLYARRFNSQKILSFQVFGDRDQVVTGHSDGTVKSFVAIPLYSLREI